MLVVLLRGGQLFFALRADTCAVGVHVWGTVGGTAVQCSAVHVAWCTLKNGGTAWEGALHVLGVLPLRSVTPGSCSRFNRVFERCTCNTRMIPGIYFNVPGTTPEMMRRVSSLRVREVYL